MKDLSGKAISLGKILVAMYGITALLLFLFALLVQKLQFQAGVVSIGISIVYVLSCFVGGFLAGKIKSRRKFLWGLFMGVLYLLVMCGITLIIKRGTEGTFDGFVGNLLLCLGGGMLGGMVS